MIEIRVDPSFAELIVLSSALFSLTIRQYSKFYILGFLPDWQVDFTLDASLTVSGLYFTKVEKGMETDATFLLNADICSRVADMIEELASA